MTAREFEQVGKTRVRCNESCEEGGNHPLAEWCLNPYLLGVSANGQQTNQVVVWCNADGAPKQDDGRTPTICVEANEGTLIVEL